MDDARGDRAAFASLAVACASGGFKGGSVYGATDAIGLKATENPVHFRDLHTTLLYQMGLDQDALSYMHLGRKERLTEVRGEVVKGLLA